jgi:hypothetical protein
MLRAEENLALRAGVIAGGGLVGLLVGMMRGRFIKRLFYTRYMLLNSLTRIVLLRICYSLSNLTVLLDLVTINRNGLKVVKSRSRFVILK